MKRLFSLAFALLPFCAMAQTTEGFTLKGKVGTLNSPAKAFLIYQVGANPALDSAAINNGFFEFKGQVLNPVNAILVIDRAGVGISRLRKDADALSFYIENANLIVTSADSVAKSTITGSPVNEGNKKLMASLDPIRAKVAQIRAAVAAAPADQQNSADFQNGVQSKLKEMQVTQEAALRNFVDQNPDNYLSLMVLSSLGGPSADPRMIEPLYNKLSPALKNMEAGKLLERSLRELKMTAIGLPAPDFTEPDVNGVPVKLSSFRGKYVLIDFWASWCGPCRQENPNVVRAYNKYKTKNFTILGVSLDQPGGKAEWLAAIKNDGLTWTQVSDLKYWNADVVSYYFIRSIPQNYLIDPDGKIIAKNLRGQDLEDKLAELFGKI